MLFKGTASQPVSIEIDIPTPVVQPVGMVMEQDWFTPYIGGSEGESGQKYSSQHGLWIKKRQPGLQFSEVTNWMSGQFSKKGTFSGQLQLKGLKWPTGNVPIFMPGICGWYSNMSPAMKWSPIIIPWCGGNRSSVDLYTPVMEEPQRNPRPMTGDDINDLTQWQFLFLFPCSEPV